MMGKRLHVRLARRLLVTVLVGLLALAGCDANTSGDTYKTMIVRNHIASFSFEYRAYYNDLDGPGIEDSAAHRFTYVTILAPKKNRPMANPEPGGKGNIVQMEYVPAGVEVRAADANTYGDRPAAARIEGSLSAGAKWPNFKLLERSTVVVGGLQAELIAYQIDAIFASWPLEYHVEVAFNSDGLQWYVDANADIDMADMLRADVDHVLQTLTILQ